MVSTLGTTHGSRLAFTRRQLAAMLFLTLFAQLPSWAQPQEFSGSSAPIDPSNPASAFSKLVALPPAVPVDSSAELFSALQQPGNLDILLEGIAGFARTLVTA
jgi:hypothetical protein